MNIVRLYKNNQYLNFTKVPSDEQESVQSEVLQFSNSPPVSMNNLSHNLDFISLIFPLICIVIVLAVIFLLNIFKSSIFTSSPTSSSVPARMVRRVEHDFGPDICVIEPTQSGHEVIETKENGREGRRRSENNLIYLSP